MNRPVSVIRATGVGLRPSGPVHRIEIQNGSDMVWQGESIEALRVQLRNGERAIALLAALDLTCGCGGCVIANRDAINAFLRSIEP